MTDDEQYSKKVRGTKKRKNKTGMQCSLKLSESPKKCDSHDLITELGDNEEGAVKITITDPCTIDQLAKTKPMEAAIECRAAWITLNSGFNNRKHELLAATCGITYNMIAIQGEWRKFCNDDFWKSFKRRPKQSKSALNKPLKWVMRFVFQARSTNEINLTNRYAKMLEKEFNEGKSQKEIVEIIQGYKGIEGMRKARVALRKKTCEEEIENNDDDDREWMKEFLDETSDRDEREYSISKEKYENLCESLRIFHSESKSFFKSRILT